MPTPSPLRILMICHGNICRSPMAERLLRHLLEEAGLADQVQVDSAAVSSEELGNPIYPPARRMLEAHGLPSGGHRAHRVSSSEARTYDWILVMDAANLSGMRAILGAAPSSKPVVRRLLSFAGEDRDVADPWWTGDFETAWADIEKGCRAVLSALRRQLPRGS